MDFDRRKFIAYLGGMAAFSSMPLETLADEAEEFAMLEAANDPCVEFLGMKNPEIRNGAGILFDKKHLKELMPISDKPTLLEVFKYRSADPIRLHCLRSAHHAMKTKQDELIIMACLIHDFSINLMWSDHAFWGADLVAPYVDEKITWGIKYHQACRFYRDEEYGYEVPELYKCLFNSPLQIEPHIVRSYNFAKNHEWYKYARLITVNDIYAFDKNVNPNIEDFIPIIEKHFKQPKEGLGNDDSPSAHMWRTLIKPDRVL